MHLWNDYEGKTVADVYPLEKLLRPEGRSAFFSTSNGTGVPAVIRLTEALNDEQESLDLWRSVAELKQANLVAIKKYGETIVDGTPLVYALMEATDANLAEILEERPLTIEETKQLAAGLVPALETLHASGLAHGHLEAANVFAAGEVIKLRSDCVRVAPAGADGEELKTRDVHDLAHLLRRSLTLRRQQNDVTPLPAPFDQIVRNGISGKWGLSQIATALGPPARPVASAALAAPVVAPGPAKVSTAARPVVSVPIPPPPSSTSKDPALTASKRLTVSDPWKTSSWFAPSKKNASIAGGAATLVLLLIGFYSLRTSPVEKNPASAVSQSAAVVVPAATPAHAPNAEATTPVAKPSAASHPGQAVLPGHSEWRVVAYTYNHVSQAQAKVATIAKQHASMKPEVFTPNGLPPYLVTLGGAMSSREQAFAFREKARASGFPHDIYAQNYAGKGR